MTIYQDVFISYSRKDKKFVRRLADALEGRGRQAWTDWDDIRPAENFMDAIYAAIESAQTFVFVLSPDSVASLPCGRELGHALKNNKRLIPIVCREVEEEKVPPALAALDWIWFRASDDFDKAIERLISAFETDLAWVKTHTRLLVWATKWEDKGRDKSLVLRGDDLREAEQTVARSTGKQPQLTELQQSYVLASRQEASRVQKAKFIAVTVALVIALVLAGVAYWQYLLAETRNRITNITESR